MCGINGMFQFSPRFDAPALRDMVHSMNERIIHRGPDAEGLFADAQCALGMRRLSIIDLQNGNQPIWNETKDKAIVFNGELYNYRPLRKMLKERGHHFTTDSDTEVVLHGYESFGQAFLQQMEGMFAFAIYDLRAKELFLARDRAGEKPLYYYRGDGYFLFSSELKSLLATGLVPRSIDRVALSTYFQLTYIPAPRTIFENVFKLLPATAAVIDASGQMKEERYWSLDLTRQTADSYEQCKRRLRDALFASVERRMVSDVPVGAFLSGGFDSTIIVGIMSQLSASPVNTFTISFPDKRYDESPLARLVAQRHRTNHTELMLDWETVLAGMETLLDNIDEPFADSSLIATYAVSQITRKYVKVALTGDAGDELFAGYDKYLISYYSMRYRKLPRILRSGLVEPAARLLPSNSSLARKVHKVIGAYQAEGAERHKRLMSLGLKPEELARLMRDGFVDPMEFIDRSFCRFPGAEEQTKAQYVDFLTVLEGDMLPKVDRASMLASLETRVPMLDRDVIELTFQMPARFKLNGKQRKIILKDTFRDLISEELFHAPKHGFGVPVEQWLEKELKPTLTAYADRDYIEAQGLFSADDLHQLIAQHMTHKQNRFSELWAFYVFQNWYRRIMH